MSAAVRKSGFTIVEMLIVVFILGILGAVVIPHFNASSYEAKVSALQADLKVVRSAIDFYAVQHKDTFPGTISGTSTWGNFVTHMTKPTDRDGNAGTAYGPYLRNGIPRNPFNNLNTGKVGPIPNSPDNSTGWCYDPETGEFYPNHAGSLMKAAVAVGGEAMAVGH
jgi:prepilin-type N-terminal cleavage/methylation domain-containing protein